MLNTNEFRNLQDLIDFVGDHRRDADTTLILPGRLRSVIETTPPSDLGGEIGAAVLVHGADALTAFLGLRVEWSSDFDGDPKIL